LARAFRAFSANSCQIFDDKRFSTLTTCKTPMNSACPGGDLDVYPPGYPQDAGLVGSSRCATMEDHPLRSALP
jgi:hypothetical protein